MKHKSTESLVKLLDFEYENMKKQLVSKKYNERSFYMFFLTLKKLDMYGLNKFSSFEIESFL